jgi:hypothetical protein
VRHVDADDEEEPEGYREVAAE